MIKYLHVLLFFLYIISSVGHAQFNSKNVEIDLITISPGEYYWEAFGHSAIRIKSDDFDKMFGFGYFDFNEDNFFLNFAKGDMRYFLGVVESDDELEGYREKGRAITSQRLDLTSSQTQNLVNKLVFLSKGENKFYQYDYFLNNCTSQIRDIIDEVTNGDISKNLKSQPTKQSWSDLTFPANNQAWMNLGIAISYGIHAYTERSQWKLSVFPEVFSQDLKNLKVSANWNADFVELYNPSAVELKTTQYSFKNTHYAVLIVIGILLVGLLFLTKTTIAFWLITQSLLGIGLLMLWFFTKHAIAMWNINVLIFCPFAFLLILEKFKKPLIKKGFLLINILWLVAAGVLTNYYLIGFAFINLIIWKKISKA